MADGTSIEARANVIITKRDDDQRLVFGWLYVSKTADGQQVVDHSGDVVSVLELEKASYGFALKHRAATEMHRRTCASCKVVNEIVSVRKGKCSGCAGSLKSATPTVIGDLVEIVVFTPEKRKAMGIPDGVVPDAIWVGFKIFDDAAWAGVKSGKFKMLSFGSRALSRELKGAA